MYIPFLITEEHKKIINNTIYKLPLKVNRLIDKKYLFFRYAPTNFPDKDELAYFIHPRFIEINLDNPRIIDGSGFQGAIVHEIAHFYIYHLSIKRKIMKLFIDKIPKELEEVWADNLTKKWGFEKELNIAKSPSL